MRPTRPEMHSGPGLIILLTEKQDLSAEHRPNDRRMLIISVDGFPRSLFETLRGKGHFHRLGMHTGHGSSCTMNSVIPTVSSVAWSTFASGRNPGGHNIFGFVDRDPSSLSLTLPNADDRKGPALWHVLGQYGIPVIVMNVPVTYPPATVNGIMIGCFLGVNVNKIATPPAISAFLREKYYIIDADTSAATENPAAFVTQLESIVRMRCAVFRELLRDHPWQFAHLHIMETDRLFHFLWSSVVNDNNRFHPDIERFFNTLDACISDVIQDIAPEDEVIIMSDHGFCTSETEWDMNAWLAENGLLCWRDDSARGLSRMAPESIAYSLLPGRIYLNLEGREAAGTVSRSDRDGRIADMIAGLKRERRPDGAGPVFRDVVRGDAVFSGPYAWRAPDIVAVPSDGVELKARMAVSPVIQPSRLQGMHTQDNAMVIFRHARMMGETPSIIDLYPTVLKFFGICDRNAEGNRIAAWSNQAGPAHLYDYRYEKGETPCQN